MTQVDRAARNPEECLALLRAARNVMHRRNALLATMPWVDEKGRGREGFEAFPWMLAGLPLLVVTLFEAHAILALPGARELVEDIAKMASKCGIKLRLEVQVPLLDQLGGSMTIRDMVAGGNVAVFRTANSLTGQVTFQGNLPVDPSRIPKFFPGPGTLEERTTAGVGFTLGSQARTLMFRAWRLEDTYAAARTGQTARLDPDSAEAAGQWPPTTGDLASPDALLLDFAAGAMQPPAETAERKHTTRDLITRFLTDHDGPAWKTDIVRALDARLDDGTKHPDWRSSSSVYDAVKAMEADQTLTELPDGRVALPGRTDQ
jgi:hypothetical protein